MLPGARSPTGQLYFVTTVPTAGQGGNGGISVSALGQIYITEIAPVGGSFENGYAFDVQGRLFCQVTGAATTNLSSAVGGIPINSNGAVLIDTVGSVTAGDYFINTVFVGPNGVRCSAATPGVTSGFSDGFSNGFGGP